MKTGVHGALVAFALLIALGILFRVTRQDIPDIRSAGGMAIKDDLKSVPVTRVGIGSASATRGGANEAHFQATSWAPSEAVSSLRPPKTESKGHAARLSSDPEAIPGELILRFKNRSDLETFLGSIGRRKLLVAGMIPSLDAIRLKGVSSDDLAAIMSDLETGERSANYFASLPKPPPDAQQPNDPPGGYKGFGLDAMSWLGMKGDRSQLGQGVKVAVLDSGVGQCPAMNEDLMTRMDLVGTQSIAGSPGNDHGTAVATILAGSISGFEGMAPSAQVLSIRIVGDDGTGDSFTLAQGIEAAILQNVQIINLSVGSRGDCPLVQQAVEHAIANGIAVVAAVGNDGADGISYPARYQGVVAVTAVDENRNHLSFANVGPEVGLAAPGYDVWASYSTNTALRFSGTSASVPFVSGAIAGLLSLNPGLKANDAAALLIQYGDDAGQPGKDRLFGSGIINPQNVLNHLTK